MCFLIRLPTSSLAHIHKFHHANQDGLAERSKAVAQGDIPQGRGFEPHSCHLLIEQKSKRSDSYAKIRFSTASWHKIFRSPFRSIHLGAVLQQHETDVVAHIFQCAFVNSSPNVWTQPTTRQHKHARSAHTHSWGVIVCMQAHPQTPILSSQAGHSSVGRASDCRILQQSDGPSFASRWPDFYATPPQRKSAMTVESWRQFGNS